MINPITHLNIYTDKENSQKGKNPELPVEFFKAKIKETTFDII